MKLSIVLSENLTPSTVKTVLFLLLLSPFIGWAQPYQIGSGDLQRKQSYLIMRDGSVVRGQILRQDSTLITVQKRNRELTFVETDQLVRIMAARPDEGVSVQNGGLNRANPPHRRTGRVFVLKDGSQVEGQFVRRDSTMITVRKPNGQLTYFEPELLVRMDSVQAGSASGGDRTFPNRFAPWLLTGLTAHNPDKGRFYYRNTWLLLNELQYGITRFWSVGAGFVTPIPYVVYTDSFRGDSGYMLTNSRLFTKLSAPIGSRFRLGVDASYRGNQQLDFFSLRDVWTFQALASVGSSQRNVTVGYGLTIPSRRTYSYYSYSMSSSFPPQPGSGQRFSYTIPNYSFLTLGVVQKLSPGLTFISDNTMRLSRSYTFYRNSKASVSAALRIDRRRHAFDLGVYSLIYERPTFWENDRRIRFFPYVGYNLLIGRD